MTASSTVRTAAAGDHGVLCALWDAVDELHRDALPTIFRKPAEPPRGRASVNATLTVPDSTILFADVEGRTVGTTTLLLRHQQSTPVRRERKYVEIEALAVQPGFRRHGVGRALVDVAIAWASGKGVDTVELNVYEFNRSGAAFYRSMGFETHFRRLKCGVRRCKAESIYANSNITPNPVPELGTKRLILRPVELTDAAAEQRSMLRRGESRKRPACGWCGSK